MKRALGMAMVLGMAAACGETAPRPKPTWIGAAGAADAAGGEPSASGGAARGQDAAGASGELPLTPVEGGAGGAPNGDELAVAGETSGGVGEQDAAGGVGSLELPGANGGAGGGDACPDEPASSEPVALATTSLKYFEGIDVRLGQGFEYTGQGLHNGTLHARGCVTGDETSAGWEPPGVDPSLDVTLTGGGLATPGTLSPYPFHASLGVGTLDEEFNTDANGPSPRSLIAYRYARATLSSYRLEHEKRSNEDDCGTSFVRGVVPAQGLAVAFRITLPTEAERDTFSRCYLPSTHDFSALEDSEPAQRYLQAHHAELSIWVLMTGGDRQGVESTLDFTGCSAAHLESCSLTLDALDDDVGRIGSVVPDAAYALSDLWPWWRVTSFETIPYTVLAD